MPHLILAFYLLALIAGTAALSQTLLMWQRYRKPVIRRYAWFLLSLYLILLGFLVDLYARVALHEGSTEARIIVWILQAAGGMTYVFTSPFFFYSLAGQEVKGPARGVFFTIDAVVVVAAGANIAFPSYLPVSYALSGILFSMIAYGIVFISLHLRGIGEKQLRRAIEIFLGLSAVFFPLMLIDAAMDLVPALSFFRFMENLAQTLYFLILNCLTVAFGLRYLDRPAYAGREGLTDYFLSAFGVTAREREIIGLLLEGTGTKRIAQKLFISPKTAENHVYNIYQKLGVRNRVQMYQMIRTNSVE